MVGISITIFADNTVVITNPNQIIKPGEEILYLWDSAGYYSTIEDVADLPDSKFHKAGKNTVSFGILDTDIWFKVKLKNGIPDKEENWIVELAYEHYDTLEFYHRDNHGKFKMVLTGDRTPFNTREIYYKNFAFPVDLKDTTEQTLFFHIKGEGSLQFPLYIQNPHAFYASQEKRNLTYGIFYGILVIMLFYNIFIYFSLKDRLYLYYVFANTCVLIFYLGYSGYGFEYFWPDHPDLNYKLIPFSTLFTGLSYVIFARYFLDSKKFLPVIDVIFKITLGIYFLMIVFTFFSNYVISLTIGTVSATFSSALILYSSYASWYKGSKFARIMALAFSSYLLGILLLTSNINGFISRSFVVAHSMEIGTAIEITLLSLALSDKFSQLRIEKETAQIELISVQRKINEELEKKVKERTGLINEQKTELEELNNLNHKLLSIISHDLRGPLNAFQSLLSMMLKDEPTKEKVSMYTSHLNNKLSLMIGLVDNILHWVRSQMGGMKMEVTAFKLNTLVKETINFYGSQAELKNITIEDCISDEIQIKADKNVVRLVMRNLLSNALKFTDNNGKVTISATENQNKILIEVNDTGVGMDEDKLKKLFTDAHFTTADTNQKEGTGLGLLLCKEFLLKVDGDIWAESKVGVGTSFKVTLPKE